MKAREYFEKYSETVREAVLGNDEVRLNEAAGAIMRGYVSDTKQLIETRNVKTDAGVVAIVKELNQKWNAMCALFEKSGVQRLKRDGFTAYMKSQIPGLEAALKISSGPHPERSEAK